MGFQGNGGVKKARKQASVLYHRMFLVTCIDMTDIVNSLLY